jgi:hypothetical protein
MGLKIIYLGVVAAVITVIQLLVHGKWGAVVVAAILAVMSHILWKFLDIGGDTVGDHLVPAVAAVAGISLGAVVSWILADGAQVFNWMVLPVPLIIGGAWTLLQRKGNSRVCSRCQTSIKVGFECPRCREMFCGNSTCWSAKHLRCEACKQREVSLFPLDDRWWAARFGKRVSSGSCMRCLQKAASTDVRECGQCQCQMCKRCWDLANGQCPRCDWSAPGLPEKLAHLAVPSRV